MVPTDYCSLMKFAASSVCAHMARFLSTIVYVQCFIILKTKFVIGLKMSTVKTDYIMTQRMRYYNKLYNCKYRVITNKFSISETNFVLCNVMYKQVTILLLLYMTTKSSELASTVVTVSAHNRGHELPFDCYLMCTVETEITAPHPTWCHYPSTATTNMLQVATSGSL